VEKVRVGKVDISLHTALAWVRDYTDDHANKTRSAPYAYPAYDRYEQDNNDPTRLSDADLLAPLLLNVRLSIRAFYGLQDIRPILESGLANEDLQRPLASVENRDQITAMIRPLYGVLDPRTRPWGVDGTTLSKVLHRKAPHSLVLHDRWVRACYVGYDGPVPPAKNRSWVDYMTEITAAIGKDIRDQPAAFAQLDAATGAGQLSYVRLLDILAWKSRGLSPTDHEPEMEH